MLRIFVLVGLSSVVLLTTLAVVPAAPIPKDAEKLLAPTKDELQASENNLKQIGLAFLNYESAYGHLPNNVYAKDGKGLLSWRVQVLPYIEENTLYQAFKFDEPWDSETNKALIGRMPKIFAPIRVKAKVGETFYRGFTGKSAHFGPDKLGGLPLPSITDGTSNTGSVFEAGEPVIWTKPDDLPFKLDKPLPKLGGLFEGMFHVLMEDGSVRRCRKGADEKELKRLIGYDDGEEMNFKKIEAN